MLSKFSVKRPYTVVVAVVLILILGFVSFDKMTVDLLPDMNLPYAVVMTTYPGASPEEVETTVTKPVEQAMSTISNISHVSSSSRENASTVILEFEQTANMDSATIEMRESLDQISGYWPDTVGNPIIMKLNPTMMPVMIPAVSVDGAEPAETTRVIQEEVLPEIESLEGVASVTTFGDIEETIRITVKEDKVSSVDGSVQNQLDKKFAEATDALDQAKSQMAEGKAQMEAGKSAASGQMAEAEEQLAQGDAELTQGQLEVNTKLSELEVAEAALEQFQAQIDASEQALNEQKQELEDLNANREQIELEYQQVLQAIQENGETSELQIAQATLAGKLALLEQYDQSMAAIEQGLAQVAEGRQTIADKQAELAQARAMLEQVQEQLNAGTLSLAQARAQLSTAQLEAALQMSQASAQLAVGESEIKGKEEELKAAKEQAKASANVKSMLTAETIQGILSAQNFNMPAGYVNEDGIDYLIRVGDKFTSIEELKNLVLVDMEGISPIKLSDVADVERIDDAAETYAKLNGENGILFQIQKQTGYSTGEVTDRILDRFEQIKKENQDIRVVILMNQGVYIDMVIGSVLQNLVFGAILAILILLLFLKDIRPTFVIACSIPISIMTAIVLMYFSGVTMNVISLSGLALGVGMLVDNSIVVIENIYRMRNEEHASAKEAAIKGAQQVAGAIMASTLTTVCVFLPIVFTEGIARQLFVDMGLTIAYSLLASLVVALTLVPMMSAGTLRRTDQKESGFFQHLKDAYEKLLRAALRFKPAVLIGAMALFVLSGVLAMSRGTAFMPDMQSTQISMSITTPKGTSLEDTAKAADTFTAELQKLKDIGDVGGMAMSGGMMGSGTTVNNQVEFYALLSEKRSMSDEKLQKAIEKIAEKEGVELSLSMSNMDMSALGSSGISVQIKGRELDQLQKSAKEIAAILKDVKGTKNVSDGMDDTTEELRVVVDKEKAVSHNLTVAQVYQELAKKLKDPSSMTNLDTDTASIGIVVVEQKNQDLTREAIQNMKLNVTKQDGTAEQVALKDIASFETGYGLQSISRDAQSRYINVTAEVEEGDNIGLVSSRVEKALKNYELPEGYTIEMKGEDETINETMTELLKMLGLAVVFMYLIMVAQFQSLRSPFIVMFTVPLAFTGGLFGLWMTGSPVSVIAMVGFVMLSGIIVNNGIVFIDYTNQLTAMGTEQQEALVEAGRTRLRPIIMTALTTILGLSTMALGFGSGADMVQPMAIVTIGGLIYGTVLTLFVVPCIYALFHKKEKARLREGIEEEPKND
ncbi:efflux RND transporter permease subunit [Faecalicatena sp. AGMB00832]|uniref:Efflux RND transporter permease subunit n=1 Tax=Faecalicatena faecalis TaxID=2726362 RepID=A0ABS6D0M2_9FIRM|nr:MULTISPECIES: efflux RND transporter permease subunit [Faecalicatena]MBU3875124.1 efflux RND transporter permease subunit [Faecalicatena faecalis]MCI6467753.1 efflux RND transporter permease subunit [Faecalicatena sp.]MDY5619605.1 efflux RND transporter permease subunit [Lachnospiraceae bacterium]